MKSLRLLLYSITLLTGSALSAHSDAAESLLEGLRQDILDGRLDEHDLFTGALIASGVESQKAIAAYRYDFEKGCRQLSVSLDVDAELAQAMFRFMHSRWLSRGYDLDATDLDAVFESRRFNCVSATVLYCCLCDHFGMPASAIAEQGHVNLRLLESDFVVETTCRRWFEMTEVERAKHRSTSQRRDISDIELLGKILYNRAVSMLGREEFAPAIELLALSLEFDPADRAARQNRLAALNNWALARCRSGQYEDGIELIERGLTEAPEYVTFRQNLVHIYHRWITDLCGTDRFEEAHERLELAHQVHPETRFFDEGRFDVLSLWLETLLKDGQIQQARTLLDNALSRHADNPSFLRSERRALARAANWFRQTGNQQLARDILQWLPPELPHAGS